MIKQQNHPDGTWNTTEYKYRGRKILIKSKPGYGMKCHVFHLECDTKVDFTLRFSFVRPETLLQKAKNRIDKYYTK